MVKKIKHCLVVYLWCLLFSFCFSMAYIYIGNEKGWPRAERWYECLTTHHHFDL